MRLSRLAILFFALWLVAGTGAFRSQAAAPTVVFSTGFEVAEGYSTSFLLAGQQGWTSAGSGGSGIVDGYFTGMGQQAYIGSAPPEGMNDFLNVWRPIHLAPVPTNQPVVKFAVTMAVISSTNGQHDDFRWSVYNTTGARLLTLDFDASAQVISYSLDDGLGFTATGWSFTRDTIYDLVITMNTARNRWSATLNGTQVAAALPLTTAGAALDIGDVDAVWAIRTPSSAGSNYLLFDNYQLTTEAVAVTQPGISSPNRLGDGSLMLRLQGEQVVRYAFEASTNLTLWTPLTTNSAATGTIDFTDTSAGAFNRRFYRVRQVAP